MIKHTLYLVVALTSILTACTHKRNGEIIKTQDGKFYRIEEAPANEAYFFYEIDTSAINNLSH